MTPPWLWPRAAYVHVPFCAHHCGYCDFAVAAGQDHLIELYLDALSAELATLGEPKPVETLFIGGGTPTYLNPDQLRRLLGAVNRWLPQIDGNPSPRPSPKKGGGQGGWKPEAVGDDSDPSGYPFPLGEGGCGVRSGAAEFSVESTPDSLTREK